MLLGNPATSSPRAQAPGSGSALGLDSPLRGELDSSLPSSASPSPSCFAFLHLVLELKEFRGRVCEAGESRGNKKRQLYKFVSRGMKLV